MDLESKPTLVNDATQVLSPLVSDKDLVEGNVILDKSVTLNMSIRNSGDNNLNMTSQANTIYNVNQEMS